MKWMPHTVSQYLTSTEYQIRSVSHSHPKSETNSLNTDMQIKAQFNIVGHYFAICTTNTASQKKLCGLLSAWIKS